MKGEATVTAYPDIFSDVIQPIYQQPIRKVIPINGKIVVDFDIHDELRYIYIYILKSVIKYFLRKDII